MPTNIELQKQLNSKYELGIKIFIPLFYIVGIVGLLCQSTFTLFTKLVPFALLLSFLLLSSFHKVFEIKKTAGVFLSIYILSFAIEAIGVNTGVIFGAYKYGESLGPKLLNTPLIIGLNWLLLVYISSSVTEKLKIYTSLKILLSATIMLMYDIIIEQVAPKLDMWDFSNKQVPLLNYISWFLIAIFFHIILKIFRISTSNKLSAVVLGTLFIFFLILTLFLK